MGAQVGEQVLVQPIVLELDALRHLAKCFLIGRPFEFIRVERLLPFKFDLTSGSLLNFLV